MISREIPAERYMQILGHMVMRGQSFSLITSVEVQIRIHHILRIHLPQRAALLNNGGTGISSSDFLTLLLHKKSCPLICWPA